MNIQTVVENLRNTIAGKEQMLAQYSTMTLVLRQDESPEIYAAVKFLEINIDELTRILQDVEQCVLEYDDLKSDLKEANGRVRQLERENSDMSWEINPDRMGL